MEGKKMESAIAATADIFRNLAEISVEEGSVKKTKALVSELCRHFYTLGWVSGTGGSVTIKVHEENVLKSNQLIVMSPSGVQKERMVAEDMYVLSSDGFILWRPSPKLYPHKPPKCTDCAALFLKIYELREAGAVIHSHGIESCIVTMINPFSKEFCMTQMEMIKGIQGHGYDDNLVVPIVENASHEVELVESVTEAIKAYPKSNAVLVRNHGAFIWGDSWITAKTQAECYHYLFAAAIKLHQLGSKCSCHSCVQNLHVTRCPAGKVPKPRHLELNFASGASQHFILLDIVGTVAPPSIFAKENTETTDMVGTVFDDVPEALKRWHANAIKVYVYSDHSREAQHWLFHNSNHGNMRNYICGYFETTARNYRKVQSYIEISKTVGVVKLSDMLVVTANLREALAARAAGMEVVILIRPGNGPLEEDHGLRIITSLLEIEMQ